MWNRAIVSVSIVLCALIFYGCTASPRFGIRERSPAGPDLSEYRGRTPVLTVEGIASYYAHDFHGRQTANGEVYDMYALTAAHKSFPFDTVLRVQNLSNDKSVVVRINDRGPFVEGRIIDLSLAAARTIDMIQSGTTQVRIEVLQWGQQ
jgi:rare lipoprotein A